MTKAQLIAGLMESQGLTKKQVISFIDAYHGVLQSEVASAGEATLYGMGKLKLVERQARTVRNPQNGEKMELPTSKNMKFVIGKGLKEVLNA